MGWYRKILAGVVYVGLVEVEAVEAVAAAAVVGIVRAVVEN